MGLLRTWGRWTALGAMVAASAVTAPQAASASARHYVAATRLCRSTAPGIAHCLGLRLRPATASTPGAHLLRVAPGYATGPGGGFTPADLATAYGVDADAPTDQVVGIVDAFDDPPARADLNVFDREYGLPKETAQSFRKVSQRGTTTLPAPRADWAGEEALDIEAVRGLCHHCKILLVEADSAEDNELAVAENEAVALGATVISNSFVEPESGPIPASLLAAFNHPGVVITAGSGDNGMDSWDLSNEGDVAPSAPSFPASMNTVVAVGGTSLTLNSDATRADETVWDTDGPSDLLGQFFPLPWGASGGGCSTQVIARGWQRNMPGFAAARCGKRRLSVDLSVVGDPFTGYDVYSSYSEQGGWAMVGGTSLSSPLVAAMWALAGGSGGVAYPSLTLYGHGNTDAASTFFDVVTGGNGYCGGDDAQTCEQYIGQSPNTLGLGYLDCAYLHDSEQASRSTGECDAAPGYDGPSGLGTPTGLGAFAPLSPSPAIDAPAAITHSAPATFSGAASTDPFPGGSITAYRWSWGDHTATAGSSPSASHTYARAGTFTVKLTTTDSYGRSASVTSTVHVS